MAANNSNEVVENQLNEVCTEIEGILDADVFFLMEVLQLR